MTSVVMIAYGSPIGGWRESLHGPHLEEGIRESDCQGVALRAGRAVAVMLLGKA